MINNRVSCAVLCLFTSFPALPSYNLEEAEIRKSSFRELELMHASIHDMLRGMLKSACFQSGRLTPHEILIEETGACIGRYPAREIAEVSKSCRKATGFGEWADLIESKLEALKLIDEEMDIKWEDMSHLEFASLIIKEMFSPECLPYQVASSFLLFWVLGIEFDQPIHPMSTLAVRL